MSTVSVHMYIYCIYILECLLFSLYQGNHLVVRHWLLPTITARVVILSPVTLDLLLVIDPATEATDPARATRNCKSCVTPFRGKANVSDSHRPISLRYSMPRNKVERE